MAGFPSPPEWITIQPGSAATIFGTTTQLFWTTWSEISTAGVAAALAALWYSASAVAITIARLSTLRMTDPLLKRMFNCHAALLAYPGSAFERVVTWRNTAGSTGLDLPGRRIKEFFQ